MMLKERPLCVCEMLSVLDISGATLSSHLKILSHAHLIDRQKEGKWIEYQLANNFFVSNLDRLVESLNDKSLIENDRQKIRERDREICSLKIKKVDPQE